MTDSHSQQTTTGLLPCPFCGSSNIMEGVYYSDGEPKRAAVRCADCGVRAPTAAWNTRAPAVSTGEPVAWVVFAENGNIRLWGADRAAPQAFADARDLVCEPVYRASAPPAEKAAGDRIAELESAYNDMNTAWSQQVDEIVSLKAQLASGDVRAAVIEECAKICDAHAQWAEEKISEDDDPASNKSQLFATTSNAAGDCAEMIRALSQAPATDARSRREEIARALYESEYSKEYYPWSEQSELEQKAYFRYADAVIALGVA